MQIWIVKRNLNFILLETVHSKKAYIKNYDFEFLWHKTINISQIQTIFIRKISIQRSSL